MFVTKNQFYVFIACIAFGVVAGFILSFFICGAKLSKNKIVENLTAVIVLFVLGLVFVGYAFFMNFPNFRAYMLIGVFVGILGYFKSFHIILAKFLKKFYNVIIKILQNDKKVKYDRSKNKKNDSGSNGRRSVSFGNTSINNGLSNDKHKSKTR